MVRHRHGARRLASCRPGSYQASFYHTWSYHSSSIVTSSISGSFIGLSFVDVSFVIYSVMMTIVYGSSFYPPLSYRLSYLIIRYHIIRGQMYIVKMINIIIHFSCFHYISCRRGYFIFICIIQNINPPMGPKFFWLAEILPTKIGIS